MPGGRGHKLGVPGMVVKHQSVGLGQFGASGVARCSMSGGPTRTLATPVPGATTDCLGLRLAGLRWSVLPRRVALGALLSTLTASGGIRAAA